MSKIQEFWQVYRLYRRAHSMSYAARIAYDCAFRGAAF